jgi:hypothetical protein
LTGTLPELAQPDRRSNYAKHRVPINEIGEDFKWSTAWVFEDARRLVDPVPYRHAAGALMWVNLAPTVGALVESANWLFPSQTRSRPAARH